MEKTIKAIGYIENDFKEKFGIPRQSGKASGVISRIHFYSPYHTEEAFKEMEEYPQFTHSPSVTSR